MTAKSAAVANRTQPIRKHDSGANTVGAREKSASLPLGVAGTPELQYAVMDWVVESRATLAQELIGDDQ